MQDRNKIRLARAGTAFALVMAMEMNRGIKSLNQTNGRIWNDFGRVLLGTATGLVAIWMFAPFVRFLLQVEAVHNKSKSGRREVFEKVDFFEDDPNSPLEKKFANGTRDEVDEASWESFPASDPPAWS